MSKYMIVGGYTSEAWKAMIEDPTDRTAAARKMIEAVGGKLESFYWSFGEDDFVGIVDAPDDLSAAAGAIVVGSSGALRNVRTIKLITADESRMLLEKAKTAVADYVPPTARPVGAPR
jgi:uncharacterized protein with GYD domain